MPEYYHWIDRKIYTWKFHKTLKEAEHIIAISECTKRDILEFGDYNPEKISVIYQSCNPRFLQYPCKEDIVKTIQKYHLPEQYLLCVGTIEERKNLLLVIKALALLPDNIHLVAVGKQTKYAKKLKEVANSLGITNRLHLLSGIDDNELNIIYKKADIFVFPSRYEGFGIPIIEAIFSGLAVVACTGSCLEEAGGPHCLYVDPDDIKGMAKSIMHIINNKEERDERIRLSMEYVQQFKGADLASKMFDVYNCIIK